MLSVDLENSPGFLGHAPLCNLMLKVGFYAYRSALCQIL